MLWESKSFMNEIISILLVIGQIGLAADEDTNTTDVAYSNAEVWTL